LEAREGIGKRDVRQRAVREKMGLWWIDRGRFTRLAVRFRDILSYDIRYTTDKITDHKDYERYTNE
jgi:hypothetical protein